MDKSVPMHLALMMDGNGRWAQKQGRTRSEGHIAGAKAMEEILDSCLELGIKIVTLYAFSTENWTRPEHEVKTLMDLPALFLKKKLPKFRKKKMKIIVSGDLSRLPTHTREAVTKAVQQTKDNDRMIVNFALNYGGRDELRMAVRSLVQDVESSSVSIEEIDETLLEKNLYTKNLPDPDIFIRTGGEKRLSNFLLWQIAGTELWFTDTYFPDFNKQLLIQAIEEVNQRKQKRFN
ncbi:isoprenyl transferase [Sporolactobacillus laevolacticus]|uniref:Isoprenyl transferase n=1 Tax=Sporolactobacillus laevolacticus DSM 442 TaxID=1395513 RepID=V6IZY5_9BACL|nr:isoprenyl transferase [Sporolactobacillus laevolacticus]EST12441.1 UDP pyrophosphate synthase [Sporolactobacillus laevolacticus DSM 442]